MPTVTGSFANMVKAGNLIDHTIKNDKIDTSESSFKAKSRQPLTQSKGYI